MTEEVGAQCKRQHAARIGVARAHRVDEPAALIVTDDRESLGSEAHSHSLLTMLPVERPERAELHVVRTRSRVRAENLSSGFG